MHYRIMLSIKADQTFIHVLGDLNVFEKDLDSVLFAKKTNFTRLAVGYSMSCNEPSNVSNDIFGS